MWSAHAPHETILYSHTNILWLNSIFSSLFLTYIYSPHHIHIRVSPSIPPHTLHQHSTINTPFSTPHSYPPSLTVSTCLSANHLHILSPYLPAALFDLYRPILSVFFSYKFKINKQHYIRAYHQRTLFFLRIGSFYPCCPFSLIRNSSCNRSHILLTTVSFVQVYRIVPPKRMLPCTPSNACQSCLVSPDFFSVKYTILFLLLLYFCFYPSFIYATHICLSHAQYLNS